jgi:macrolide-specific efflux system membrane fusion protein
MSKKKISLIILVLIIAVGAGFYFRSKKTVDKKGVSALVPVREGTIEETVDATGEVAPLNRVEIKPPISGRIEKLLVDEGADVKAGQVLAWMSSSDRAAILDAARAQGASEVKRWEDSYKPTPILAPLSGVVILRDVVVGQVVDPSTILFAMSDKLIVLAQVDEADIGRVKGGMAARITLDAYPDQTIDGRVFQILHEGKNVSNVITYGVKIEPKRVPSFFRSQMTANVNLIVRSKENALFLPKSAVNQGKVMVPDEKGKPIAKDVETGIQSGERIEIVSGLTVDEKVFVSRGRYTPQRGTQNSPFMPGGNSNRRSGGGAR